MSGIPLVDLRAAHAEVADEVRAGFERVQASAAFVGGPDVAAFEAEFARFGGVGHCVGVANGTDALELMLRADAMPPGAGVVMPANTFVATAEAVVRAGGTPVFADVDDEFLLLDPDSAARAASAADTWALLPVHLNGQLAPMEPLVALASDTGLRVFEDAAQCQGATRHGRAAGTWGRAAGTSFYPGKNLGAYGDAGAVLTDDGELAGVVREIADHGSPRKYVHSRLGVNSRLDTLQAVVLRAKLRRLAAGNAARRAAAARYDALLADLADDGLRLPRTAPGNDHVWHLYAVRVPHRDAVLADLGAAGIGAGVHYPVPVHLQPAFGELGYARGDFPVAERAAGEILTLPLFPQITEDQQARVAEALAKALANALRGTP
ncbi:DegT/DnrJ/EryC1/StrS family aminotransferase [Yinghuangia sp. ASG 101]|uniref:DegT/DnrJ/EryC1/StrS family aminotransferase n=1 Tax=Yinghuangia sp. ASG 101 TaxID=2896848 RepID=UPI001E4E8627|nr:DegT/DnrJ/EryC1/StrS family aminotransferase [Yinghuangia sp. ASG 101]UGQ14499.1 DegT/DnrJ/EryC1/StrS family aminotransferase [Yinghuangia sp. ASG 101]